jgi:zinc protease
MNGSFCRLCRALTAVCFVSFSAAAYAQTAAQAPKADQKAADATSLPSARSIIDRHIEAIGGRKALAARTSHRVQGTMEMPANGISAKLELLAARPNKTLLRLTIPGVGEVAEGFDGTRGWSVSPMTGPMLSTGVELEERKHAADFDSELREDSRYEYLKTVDKTTFEGRPVYKIALKRKGGTTEDIEYYDVETGLRAGTEATRNSPMGAVSVVAIQTDYKKFGDIMFPTTIKQKMMGMEQIMTLTSIEHDVVDPTVFEMPPAVKALVK